ncbi:MAG: pyrroline-5-carboxylate reductase family protein [Boseongicola sp.]
MKSVGIIGGSGALGGALARAWLDSGEVPDSELWISNRSGDAGPFVSWSDVTVTTDTDAMIEAVDIVVLSVPPSAARDLRISAVEKLVISVMAGVTLAELRDITGSERVIRAMSSPAAAMRLAYSPWTSGGSLSESDANEATRLLSATGKSDRLQTEDQIDRFTAITGPVPGFVAAFADAVVAHAIKHDIPNNIAVRATQQLFLAAGLQMNDGDRAPRDFVDEMINYDGTTAAGLRTLDAGQLKRAIDQGLEAAYQRTKTI